MTIDRPNISTEHQPKGSGRNPSDTLDRPVGATSDRPSDTKRQGRAPAEPVIDEKGRPIDGDGTLSGD